MIGDIFFDKDRHFDTEANSHELQFMTVCLGVEMPRLDYSLLLAQRYASCFTFTSAEPNLLLLGVYLGEQATVMLRCGS